MPVIDLKTKRCEICDHFSFALHQPDGPIEPMFGHCRRHAPTVFVNSSGVATTLFPGMWSDGACGDWERA